MNVRFSAHAVRFRVTHAELDRLMSGRDVALEVALPPAHALRASVRPTTIGQWRLDSDPTGIWLTVPRAELESLTLLLPRKEGLQREFATASVSLHVSVEVDLADHNSSRSAAAS